MTLITSGNPVQIKSADVEGREESTDVKRRPQGMGTATCVSWDVCRMVTSNQRKDIGTAHVQWKNVRDVYVDACAKTA